MTQFFYTYVRSCSSLMFQSQAKNEGQEFTFFANGLLGARNPPLLGFLAQRGEIISERLFFIFMKYSCYESRTMDTLCADCDDENTQKFS